MMQNVHSTTTPSTSTTTANTQETPTKAHATAQDATHKATSNGAADHFSSNTEMDDGSAMNVAEFDTIMTDAANRKRFAEENSAEATHNKKKAQNQSPLRRSGRGQ